jgi:hypothetical protein
VVQHDYLITDYGPFKVQAAGADTVTIQTYFPYTLTPPVQTSFTIVHNVLELTSPTEDEHSAIKTNAAEPELGLALDTVVSQVYGAAFTIDTSGLDIREDDLIYGVGFSDVHIKIGGSTLLLKTAIPVATGATLVLNPDYASWDTLKAAIEAYLLWISTYGSLLQQIIAQLLVIAKANNPKSTQINAIRTNIATCTVQLQLLQSYFQSYEIRYLGHIDLLFKLLDELGADRALYLLETCQFSNFMALASDEISFRSYFATQAGELVKDVANVSRYKDGTLDEALASILTVPSSERFGDK